MADDTNKPETDKTPRRRLSVEEKLLLLRDSKRKALAKLNARELALSKQLALLRLERAQAEAELERIQAACPAEPPKPGEQPPAAQAAQ